MQLHLIDNACKIGIQLYTQDRVKEKVSINNIYKYIFVILFQQIQYIYYVKLYNNIIKN